MLYDAAAAYGGLCLSVCVPDFGSLTFMCAYDQILISSLLSLVSGGSLLFGVSIHGIWLLALNHCRWMLFC